MFVHTLFPEVTTRSPGPVFHPEPFFVRVWSPARATGGRKRQTLLSRRVFYSRRKHQGRPDQPPANHPHP
eukprot:8371816-Pyramimonas_sp.AAC.1